MRRRAEEKKFLKYSKRESLFRMNSSTDFTLTHLQRS